MAVSLDGFYRLNCPLFSAANTTRQTSMCITENKWPGKKINYLKTCEVRIANHLNEIRTMRMEMIEMAKQETMTHVGQGILLNKQK